MFKLTGFHVLQKLYLGQNSRTYRAVKISNKQSVILKTSVTQLPDTRGSDKLFQEYTIRQGIQSDYVIKFEELYWDPEYGYVLVEEDSQANVLTEYIPSDGFPLADFLDIAIQLAQGLSDIHQGNVIHKDIKPNNILWIPNTQKIKYIDFGSAIPLRQSNQTTLSPYISVGTLNYISPEQTGRMNCTIDYRTDFYSLGVTYYQLITGHLPFTSNSTLELLHSHIAKMPISPHLIKPEIPLILSHMIMKLLAKDAEARYQSAKGLLADLKQCVHALQKNGEIERFDLGQHDITELFLIPQKLYGREKELETLLKISKHMHQGSPKVCMITGHAGVGKTVFVKEIQKHSMSQEDYFLYGKFEQLNRNIAYNAIIQAFQMWVKQFLFIEGNNLIKWKNILLDAVGNNGQLILDVIPELELIIGTQPSLPTLDINQTEHRFHLVFQALLAALATQQHPLILFLDDLQWADSASLNLIEAIFLNRQIKYFLLIGAYRDKEVKATHPTLLTLKEIEKNGVDIQNIELIPLSRDNVQHWLAETFQCPLQEVDAVTNLICLKTQGNPFFIKFFLQALYNEQVIVRAETQGWQWDIEKIRQHPATDNVLEFMEAQLAQLPTQTRKLMEIASCIGHCFRLTMLQQITQHKSQDVLKFLKPLLENGMIIAFDDYFKFNHDRIQEAAHHTIPPEKRAAIHCIIGRILEAKLSETSSQTQLFEVVDQLNQGKLLITARKEKLHLARLNMKAAKKAKNAIAYSAALSYLKTTEECLAEIEIWNEDSSFAYEFYKELAEVEYLNNHFDRVTEISHLLLSHSPSVLEQAEIYTLLIEQNTVTGHYEEAIDLGLKALRLLGVEIPQQEVKTLLATEYEKSRIKLADKSTEYLLSQPDMERLDKKAAIKLLYATAGTAFIADPPLYVILSIMMVNLTLDFGNVEESAIGYAGYAMLLIANFNEAILGNELGQLAIKLSEKFNDLSNQCRTNHIYATFIHHWFNPFCEVEKYMRKAYQTGWESGEFQYLGYLSQYQAIYYFYKGLPLASIYAELFKLAALPHNANHPLVISVINAMQLIILNLTGKTTVGNLFYDETKTETNYQADWQREKNSYILCNYFILKAQALYFNGYFEEALACIYDAEPYLPSLSSHIATAIYCYYHSLIMTKLYNQKDEEVQKNFLEKLKENLTQLQQWAKNCPENFQYHYTLIAAEIAKLLKNNLEAIDLYNKAIDLLETTEFTQEIALANELAANFWLENGKKNYARGLLCAAYNYYLKWGSHYKIVFLKSQYSDLLDISTLNPNSSFDVSGEYTVSAYSLKLLNLSSILQASQAISKNIDLDNLLNNIMKIAIENAGAQKGTFFILEEDKLLVQAEYRVGGNIETLQRLLISDWSNGAKSIINYVQRTLRHVLLGNASGSQMFNQDPYVVQYQVKSALCLPIIKNKQLKAILYLENNLSPYAFTDQHLEILLLLAGQMVISLENAHHFAKEIALARQIEEKDQQRKLALRSANMGTWKWNLQDNTMDVDDRLLALYGVTRESFESAYENFISLIHPDDRATVKQAIDRTLEEGVPFEIEFRVIKPSDHSVHILAGRADVVRDHQGQPEFMIGVNWDITQQKRLEEDKLLNAVLRASQAIQSGTLFHELATMGQDWGAVKKELVMGEGPSPGIIPSLSKEGVALEHMKGLVEYRDILDYIIYQQAVKAIFPPSHYEIVSELKENEGGYTFIVYNRADAFKKSDIFEMRLEPIKSELSSERPCCEIKVTAPGSRTLTSDIDTSIYVAGATGAHSLDITFADATVRNRGPDYNGRIRNQVIAHFYRINEELHHMTSSISRDSNAYADTITDDEKEYLKFNFTPDNNPLIKGHFIIQDPLFYAEYKLTKHYQEQAASIIPMLRALTAEEWGIFKAQAISELQNRLKSIYSDKRHEDYFNVAEIDLKQIFSLAETLHQEAERIINHKTEQENKERVEYWESSPLCRTPERLAMDMKISAMNRLYVDYLEKVVDANNEIINLKQKQQDLVLQLEELHSQHHEINKKLTDKNTEEELLFAQQTCYVLTQQIKTMEQQLLTHLKQKACKFLQKQALQIKANLFAHEAYINRSAVHHVVNGMLLYKGKISLSKQTIMGSALQQLGFRLNHANQLRSEHKSEGEIAYYCAKYSHRVFDLIFNNNESPLREVPYTDEQIESLTKDSTHNSLNVLARLKVAELQSQLHLFFTLEEYHLLNSEMKIITHVKKREFSVREKPERAKAFIKERMCLIDKDNYPNLKNITDEELQVFTKIAEKNIFISVAIKLMVAVYIAKLELKKGFLWSQISTVQPTFLSIILQPDASDVGFNFNNNRLTYTPTLFPSSPNMERLNTSKNITDLDPF